MAISSMVLRQPSLSRASSNSQLPNPTDANLFNKEISRSRGAFASNYVANHLKDNPAYISSDELGIVVFKSVWLYSGTSLSLSDTTSIIASSLYTIISSTTNLPLNYSIPPC